MSEPESLFASPRLERLPAVLERVQMSRAWLYDAVARGSFPPPVKLGRASVWDSRAVDRWIDSQTATATA
jgi:predicted DNA-binding transcriptional regulator AlpA